MRLRKAFGTSRGRCLPLGLPVADFTGGVSRELGLEFWHLFSENRCFHSRSVKKMEKTEKGGRWRRRIFFSKKNRILLFKWSATALAPKGAAGYHHAIMS